MNEANEYKITFGPYSAELKSGQVYFKKNNSLMKAIPVKSTFGLYDFRKMVQKVAASVKMTHKLPKDVIKANKNEYKAMNTVYDYVKKGRPIKEEINSDLKLPADKQLILQADTEKQQRGLKVCWKSTGGYHIVYWYGSPDNEVPAELRAAPELPEDDIWKNHGEGFGDHKHVWVGYHPSIDEGKEMKNKINERDMGYYVWSGTYGQDKPNKMKGFTYVKDLKASIEATKKNKAKYGNARAMIAYEFEKQFPKAFKALAEGFASDAQRRAAFASGYKAKGKKKKKNEDAKAISNKNYADYKKNNKLKKEMGVDYDRYGDAGSGGVDEKFEDPGPINPVTIINTEDEMKKKRKVLHGDIDEDYVKRDHMYQSLTYKVKDAKAVMDAYKKFKAGNRTINMVVKKSGDEVTISGHPTKGRFIAPSIADQLDAAIQKTGKAKLVKSDSKKLKENKMNKSEIKFRKMIREIAKPMLKSAMNEISVKAGLQDIMKGRTPSIEGIKMSKEMAENLMYWINTSPYGRKYGKYILKGRIASLIGPANAMGFGDRLKGKLKGEWKAIVAKHGPKREAVIEQLQSLKEEEMEGQVNVYGYQTKHFDVCPGAQSLYKRIQDEDLVDTEKFVVMSAKLHDALFAIEKDAIKRGGTEKLVTAAQVIADKIMKLARMMNLESEHSYVQGHVDKIKDSMNTDTEAPVDASFTDGEVNEMSDSQMLKMAMKGAKQARVGTAATKAYIDSLKNSWRLNPRDKKDYKNFSIDDWEEDVLYYIQNK